MIRRFFKETPVEKVKEQLMVEFRDLRLSDFYAYGGNLERVPHGEEEEMDEEELTRADTTEDKTEVYQKVVQFTYKDRDGIKTVQMNEKSIKEYLIARGLHIRFSATGEDIRNDQDLEEVLYEEVKKLAEQFYGSYVTKSKLQSEDITHLEELLGGELQEIQSVGIETPSMYRPIQAQMSDEESIRMILRNRLEEETE